MENPNRDNKIPTLRSAGGLLAGRLLASLSRRNKKDHLQARI